MSSKQGRQPAQASGHVHGPGCDHDHAGPDRASKDRAASETKLPAEPKLKIQHRSDDADQRSKDELFVRLALVAQSMIDAHGKDFAMGALVLSARFIAEGKPLVKSESSPAAASAAAVKN